MSRAEGLRKATAILIIMIVGGCESAADHARTRRSELLNLYPPGKTSRSDVAKKWSPTFPDVSERRPDQGWNAAPRQDVREYVLASEKRTGRSVLRCERYWGPDPSSWLGLEYNWFFYDGADMVTDIEWQYHTD